ncbi:MAG: hypothetical protein M3M95_02330 [Pseudomonadota bacterium]|nr:hypothetical protein [Pseudomonadota bacterium]
MNAAEYVSVLVSIVIGLAIADILFSLHRLLRAGRRVKWDWAAPLATALVLMVLVMMWWSFYQPEPRPLSIGEFLPSFVLLVLLFLLGGAALPDETPAEGIDLRAYYDSNGRYFWTLFALTMAWLLLVDFVGAALRGADLRPVLEGSLVEFGILAVFVSLIFVRRRWWHAVAFLILATGPVGWVARTLG